MILQPKFVTGYNQGDWIALENPRDKGIVFVKITQVFYSGTTTLYQLRFNNDLVCWRLSDLESQNAVRLCNGKTKL